MRSFRSLSVKWLAVALVACTATSPGPTGTPAPTPTPVVTLRVLVTRAQSGQPVAGAHVCAATARGADVCADAGQDGAAALRGPPGTYFVRVTGPAEQHWQEADRQTDLVNGDGALWVELTPLQRISGRVRDDAGALVSGAEACAYPASSDPQTCARSGADGTYAIDVKPGVYRVEVSGPPGERLVGQWARGRAFLEEADVIDARTKDVADVDVTLIHGVVLRGTVTFKGKVVEDAQVCIRTLAAPLPWECERTDKNGRYAALREPGQYYVWTVPPATIAAVPQWYDGVLTGVQTTAVRLVQDRVIDVDLTGGPQLSGTVRSTSGQAVANALVCVDTAFTTGRICRETDGNGHYTVTTRPETYIVSVFPPSGSGLVAEYWEGKRSWRDADEIVVDRDRTLDLTVERGIPVTGTVKDLRGVPVAGATVNFLDGQRYAAASTDTDASGRFAVAVRPGQFTIEVFPPFLGNYMERVTSVDVRGAMELQLALDDAAPQ